MNSPPPPPLPANYPVGPRPVGGDYTGRCMTCGSKNLWADNLTYGCSDCKAIYFRS